MLVGSVFSIVDGFFFFVRLVLSVCIALSHLCTNHMDSFLTSVDGFVGGVVKKIGGDESKPQQPHESTQKRIGGNMFTDFGKNLKKKFTDPTLGATQEHHWMLDVLLILLLGQSALMNITPYDNDAQIKSKLGGFNVFFWDIVHLIIFIVFVCFNEVIPKRAVYFMLLIYSAINISFMANMLIYNHHSAGVIKFLNYVKLILLTVLPIVYVSPWIGLVKTWRERIWILAYLFLIIMMWLTNRYNSDTSKGMGLGISTFLISVLVLTPIRFVQHSHVLLNQDVMDDERVKYHSKRAKEKTEESLEKARKGDLKGSHKSSKEMLHSYHQVNKYKRFPAAASPGVAPDNGLRPDDGYPVLENNGFPV